MDHRKAGRKLGMKSKHREAVLRNMVTSLFDHGKIQTTDARAKELRPMAEKLITLAKKSPDGLAARRLAMRLLRSKDTMRKLFGEIAPRFTAVSGGYTKIIKVGQRLGDAAPVSLIRLLDEEEAKKAAKGRTGAKKKKAKAAPAAAPAAEPAPEASAA